MSRWDGTDIEILGEHGVAGAVVVVVVMDIDNYVDAGVGTSLDADSFDIVLILASP